MLHKAYNVVLLSGSNQFVVVCKKLDSRLCYQDMNPALNGIERDGKVSG